MIKPNVIVGLVFVFLVIVLSYLSYKGRLKNTWLEKADKISRIISMGIAVVAFLNPFPDHPLKPEQSISLDNNNQNINIGQSNSGNVTIGDTSTSAKQRAEVAVAQVKQELVKNFNTLAVLINTIENQPPTKFWDIRRANESELAYQDRATNEFRDYQKLVGDLIKLNNFSRALYLSFQRELSYNSNIAERIKKTYEYQEEVRDSFARFESGLQHNLSLRLSNSERTARSISLHQEKIANAKMNLALSIADFCLLSNPNDVKLVSDSLAIALPVPGRNKNILTASATPSATQALLIPDLENNRSITNPIVDLEPGRAGYKTAMKLASQFAQMKTHILQARLPEQSLAANREIDRRIKDPYLLMLREKSGLPSMLTPADLNSLQKKSLNRQEKNPEKLFGLAAFSYIESDGNAAKFYFQQAIATGKLPRTLDKFARLSIHRLSQPETYNNSIGMMVLKLSPSGNFERAGIRVGDVITDLDNQVVNEPLDIA